ncbi:MAG: alkaline phosphatase family protein [Gemmatimonadota bacterium]|nr:MAG: alkaline phosphatase family protein [Gemmatimonadota bacterium]
MHSRFLWRRLCCPTLTILTVVLSCRTRDTVPPPRLVVQISLDQFRSDYLERYDEAFVGGLKRLKEKGLWYPRAIVDHGRTLSHPGHTTLATGAYPSTHGVSTNESLETLEDGRLLRRILTDDPHEGIVGHPGERAASSKRIRVTALSDWIRSASDRAQAVALSTGPALAVDYGGHPSPDKTKNHVYWLSGTSGEFVTSTYYRDSYPDWLSDFNRDRMPEFREEREWSLTVPESLRDLARRDDTPYEADGVHTTFPHRYGENLPPDQAMDPPTDGPVFNRWFSDYSPGANRALFALAEVAVQALALGMDDATDYLAIAVKSTDRVGHDFGPRSLEQLDNILRIDAQLGEFFEFLDETVGEGRWLVNLAADHGAPNIVEYELEQGRPGRRVGEGEIRALLEAVDRFVREYDGPEAELPALVARELEKADFVARAMTPGELEGEGPADEILRLYRNSHVPGHRTTYPLWIVDVLRGNIGPNHPAAFGVVAELIEGAQIWTARSTHGGSYLYDREVPLLFMGPGVVPGIATESARTIDVAPTLASLAGLTIRESVDGRVLAMAVLHPRPAPTQQGSDLFFDDFERDLAGWKVYGSDAISIIESHQANHGTVLRMVPAGEGVHALIPGSDGWESYRMEADVLFPENAHSYFGFIYNYRETEERIDFGSVYLKGNGSYVRVNPRRDWNPARALYEERRVPVAGEDSVHIGEWVRVAAEVKGNVCHFYVGDMETPKVTFDFFELDSGMAGVEPRVAGGEVWVDNVRVVPIDELGYQGPPRPLGEAFHRQRRAWLERAELQSDLAVERAQVAARQVVLVDSTHPAIADACVETEIVRDVELAVDGRLEHENRLLVHSRAAQATSTDQQVDSEVDEVIGAVDVLELEAAVTQFEIPHPVIVRVKVVGEPVAPGAED